MTTRNVLRAAAVSLALLSHYATAADPIKIGVVAPMSGVFSSYGKQIENGINVFLRENGDVVAGRKISIVYRDNAGPNPEAAKRAAQELVANDKVDLLAGFAFTPDAMAAAPIATQAKKPMYVMLAATSSVSTKSPYIVRTSYTIPQVAEPMGTWAAKNGIKRVFMLVSDYGPGHDAETWFKKGFAASGGELVGEVRVPVATRDFSPFLRRIKDAKPDAVFTFLPAGEPIVSFMKGFAGGELAKSGIKVLATEGWADDDTLAAVGDAAIGAISTGYYSTDHPSAINRQFIANFANVGDGKLAPNFIGVAAYDAMRVIYEGIKKQNGKVDAEQMMALAKGLQFESPRGPALIDKDTRDIVQNVYVRKVEKVGGKLVNREFDTFSMVKDPGK
ncbi:ABC transporter substrate-binding protein [Noviherbaspirillum cavernae]|uniref:ABC transporter substrate-binding protein n=1 Tax=Noviherbaspirillum cavernae TaxID=2320862 RepID=A0A418WWC2_9BURK|nr:ABC transporter substrate-binding protein [Noviherbaspirillum cavernae]RJF96995.1 ABC transporter substrate-binding protein [Noviherbaspirillum cavernae]